VAGETETQGEDDRRTSPGPNAADGGGTGSDTGGVWQRVGKNALAVAAFTAVVSGAVGVAADWIPDPFEGEPPSCPGTACDGHDPESQGCGEDARTYEPRAENPVKLQIRYSESCKAVWAKVEAGEVGDRVTVSVEDEDPLASEIHYGRDQFTRMSVVDPADFRVEACAVPTRADERTGTWEKYCIHATETSAWH
jgi:hypothetical protein